MNALGLIKSEPIDVYHASPAISHSKLQFFRENFAADYHAKYIAKTYPREARKEHFDFGTAVEARCISELEYKSQVAVSPYDEFRTDLAKGWRNEMWAAKRIVLKRDAASLAMKCFEAVMRNPDARAIIEGSQPQKTFRVKLESVSLQNRCDFWANNGVTLPSDGTETGPLDADLKTCDSIHEFQKQSVDLGYDHAAIFYREVIRLTLARIAGVAADSLPYVRRMFIAVDKTQNPSCIVYDMTEELLRIADHEVIGDEDDPGLLHRLLGHYQANTWPGAPVRGEIAAPYWKRRKSA